MTNSQKLIDFCYDLKYEDIPDDVLFKAKQCIFDYLGIVIGGSQSYMGKKIIESAQWLGPDGKANLIGTKETASVLAAAFVNGTLCEVLELQDGWRFGNIHACVVIPSMLAIASEKKVTGKEAIKSVVCGYEVANRIAHTVHPNHLKKGYLPTATAGTCGAAMTASLLLDLTKEESRESVGIASFLLPVSTAENLWGGYSIKPYHSGQASKQGIESAMLAKQGFEACPLEGSPERGRGWPDITTGDVKYDRLLKDLGTKFVISDVYFKVYPCCRHAHHAVEAATVLSKRLPDNLIIDRIVERTYDLAAGLLNRYPHRSMNQVAYQFSIPYGVAFSLKNKGMNVFTYVVDNLISPEMQSLASKVEIISDPELTKIYPDVTPSIVEVYGTVDGKPFFDSERCEMPIGDPRVPVTPEGLTQKFRDLTEPVIGEEGCRELESLIFNLDQYDDVNILTETIQKYLK